MKSVSYYNCLLLFFGTICFYLARCVAQQEPEKWISRQSDKEKVPFVVEQDRGNWYQKRKIYKDAGKIYSQLLDVIDATEKLDAQFYEKRNSSEKMLAKLYLEAGLDQGAMQARLEDLIKTMQTERERNIELTEEERKLLANLKANKESIQRVKSDMETLSAADEDLNKAMTEVLKILDKARQYRRKSEKLYESIRDEINDLKAKQLYLELQTDLDNVKKNNEYLKNKLAVYFDTKIQEIATLANAVRNNIQQLKEKGVELAKQVTADEAAHIKKSKEEAELLKQKLKEEQAKQGWWQKIKNWFSDLFGFQSKKAMIDLPKKV